MSLPSSTPSGDQPSTATTEHWGNMPELRGLRRLVIVLTTTLSLGVLTVAAALVIRIMSEPAPAPTAIAGIDAAEIILPAGETPIAVGTTAAAITLVTSDKNEAERLRVYSTDSGALIDTVMIRRE